MEKSNNAMVENIMFFLFNNICHFSHVISVQGKAQSKPPAILYYLVYFWLNVCNYSSFFRHFLWAISFKKKYHIFDCEKCITGWIAPGAPQ